MANFLELVDIYEAEIKTIKIIINNKIELPIDVTLIRELKKNLSDSEYKKYIEKVLDSMDKNKLTI